MLKLAFVLTLVAASAHAQDKAGEVLFAFGKAERIAADGVARPLSQGDSLHEGDLLRTGPDSHLQARMIDRALIALRPGTELRLESYRFPGREGGAERAFFELMDGAFRSITGAIGHGNREHYRIKSHRTVLGIRGTDHETFFVGGRAAAGTYNRVSLGGTYLQTRSGRIDLEPGQTGFAALELEAVPVLLPRTPEFMLAALPPAARDSGPPVREGVPADEERLEAPLERSAVERVYGTGQNGTRSFGPNGIRSFGRGGRGAVPKHGPPAGKGKP